MPLIVMYGESGSGKSFISNRLSKHKRFIESDKIISCTSKIELDLASFTPDDNVADTPGFFDGVAVD